MRAGERSTIEPNARGLVATWLVAKTAPRLARLVVWAARLTVLVAYVGVAWLRARRALLAGALDGEVAQGEPLPSAEARERGVLGWVRGSRDVA